MIVDTNKIIQDIADEHGLDFRVVERIVEFQFKKAKERIIEGRFTRIFIKYFGSFKFNQKLKDRADSFIKEDIIIRKFAEMEQEMLDADFNEALNENVFDKLNKE